MIVSHLLLVLQKKNTVLYLYVWSLKCGKRSESSRGPNTFARHYIYIYIYVCSSRLENPAQTQTSFTMYCLYKITLPPGGHCGIGLILFAALSWNVNSLMGKLATWPRTVLFILKWELNCIPVSTWLQRTEYIITKLNKCMYWSHLGMFVVNLQVLIKKSYNRSKRVKRRNWKLKEMDKDREGMAPEDER